MTTIQQMATAEVSPEITFNEVVETFSAIGIFGKNHNLTSGLEWGYYGGLYIGSTITSDSVTLTDNDVNYVVVHRATGVVSASTSSTNSLDTDYAKLYKVTTVSGEVTVELDQRMDDNGLLLGALGGGGGGGGGAKVLQFAVSDETTPLSTGTAIITVRAPYAFATLTGVRGSLSTAQGSGSIFAVDIKVNGSTIFSTLLTIDNTEKTSTTATTPAVLTASSIADDAEITVDITQIGNGTAKGLKIALIGT